MYFYIFLFAPATSNAALAAFAAAAYPSHSLVFSFLLSLSLSVRVVTVVCQSASFIALTTIIVVVNCISKPFRPNANNLDLNIRLQNTDQFDRRRLHRHYQLETGLG